jgi:hypothetical protein
MLTVATPWADADAAHASNPATATVLDMGFLLATCLQYC